LRSLDPRWLGAYGAACRALRHGVLGLALTGGLAASRPAAADVPSLASSVAFGTTCARCHEAECSGRLSFSGGKEEAAGHIRRHAGAISDSAVAELFALLEAMKRECAYTPVAAPPPADGRWAGPTLARLCVPSRESCLVPLGPLAPGDHRIDLEISGTPHVHAEVVTRFFEALADEPLEIAGERSTVSFQSLSPSEPFLRLQASEPLELREIRLRRQGEP
jgi:hypothetical protein